MKQYLDTVREILEKGTRKENRTGIDAISTFNINYEIDMNRGFPLLTTKEINWKNIVIENLWFLSGDPSIKLLQKHGCKFWDDWANKDDGAVPSAYGNFWRHFPIHESDPAYVYTDPVPAFNDQIKWVLGELIKNPMSRRLVVSAWAPGNAQTSKLPPCHAMFIMNVQNNVIDKKEIRVINNAVPLHVDIYEQTLNLHLTQRSCDIALGVPYNIAGYAFLLRLFAHFSGIKPGIFAHTLVDAHAYTSKPDGSMAEYDHVPGLKEQLRREVRKLPTLEISPDIKHLGHLEELIHEDTATIMQHFQLKDYNPHPAIKFKVAV